MLEVIFDAVVVRAAVCCPPSSRIWAVPLEALDLISKGRKPRRSVTGCIDVSRQHFIISIVHFDLEAHLRAKLQDWTGVQDAPPVNEDAQVV